MLINYQKEYIQKIIDTIPEGMFIHRWENYNNFISILHLIIEDNMNIIQNNQKKIEESLVQLSKRKIKLKIWQYLNTINKKQILKIKKIQEQTINDHYAQLKILNKGYFL